MAQNRKKKHTHMLKLVLIVNMSKEVGKNKSALFPARFEPDSASEIQLRSGLMFRPEYHIILDIHRSNLTPPREIRAALIISNMFNIYIFKSE